MRLQYRKRVVTTSLLMAGMLLISACGAPAATPAASTAAASTAAASTAAASTAAASTAAASTAASEAAASAAVSEAASVAASTAGAVSETAVLTYGMAGTFDKLDPNATTFSRVGRVALHFVDPLVWQPTAGTFESGLATEWSINDDATEYTFKLREGVTFHDGTPFNATAVKWTFDRIADPNTKAQTAFSLLGPYKGAEIVNDYEIKVLFNTPFAPFLNSLSTSYLAPVSPTAFERVGADNWGITEVVGTGPFKLTSFTPDSEIVLDRNPDYNWGPAFANTTGPAKISQIVFKIIPEPATRIASL